MYIYLKKWNKSQGIKNFLRIAVNRKGTRLARYKAGRILRCMVTIIL